MPAAPGAVACGGCGATYVPAPADGAVCAPCVPRLLPCGHSLCTGCAQSAVDSGATFALPLHTMSSAPGSAPADVHVAAVTCPCGCAPTPVGGAGVAALPVDVAAAELAAEGNPAASVVTCEECEDAPATLWCELCSSEFCQECFSKVHAPRVMRKHKPVPVAEKPPPPDMCPTHPRQERTMFCTSCQRKVCALCCDERFDGRHVGDQHACVPLEQAAQAAVDRVRAQLHKLSAKKARLSGAAQRAAATLAGLPPSQQHAAAAVAAQFAELRRAVLAALDQREAALLKEAAHVSDGKMRRLREHVSELGTALSRVGRACGAVEQKIRGNPVDVLDTHSDIARMLGDAQRAADAVKTDDQVDSVGVPLQFSSSLSRQLCGAVMTHGVVGRGDGPRVTAVTAGAEGPVEAPVAEEDERRARRQLGLGGRGKAGARLQGRPLLAAPSPRAGKGHAAAATDPAPARRRREQRAHSDGDVLARTLPAGAEQPARKDEDAAPTGQQAARLLLMSSNRRQTQLAAPAAAP